MILEFLKNVFNLYTNNWDLIIEENYGVLPNAIFDSEETEDVQGRNKVENTEQVRVSQEEALEQDELGQPLKSEQVEDEQNRNKLKNIDQEQVLREEPQEWGDLG
ncbi:hypothetical protein ACH5RR_001456 [Cinchona calisaya]|uniref:WIYLD domain-containing protein n=1 Tax=Cinchona calisaya TaxID=153742 RepID=A0ABD3B3K2_9GENT